MNTFFISDTHFGHFSIVSHCRKEFEIGTRDENLEFMEETMIERWNSVVKKDDRVYHAGDFAWTTKDAKRVRQRLNGHIRLYVGNHDDVSSLAATGMFQRMNLWRHFEFDPKKGIEVPFTLTHIPLMKSQFRHDHKFNVHGHTHLESLDDQQYINISAEQLNYTPLSLEDLMHKLKKNSEALGFS